MTDYGRTDIFLGESRVNRSALLLQQQVFLHNKINRTIPETGYFCAVPGFLRFKRAVIYAAAERMPEETVAIVLHALLLILHCALYFSFC